MNLHISYWLFEIEIESGSIIPFYVETNVSIKMLRNLPKNKVIGIRLQGGFARHTWSLIVSI